MFSAISAFEVRYQLRQPLFYAVTILLGIMTFGAIVSDSVQIGGSIGNVHRNAPYVIMRTIGVLTLIGMFVTTAFVGSAAQRDFEHGTASLFFSKPLRKSHYLAGRFLGSLGISILVFLGPMLGIILGSFMPWLEPERLGPFQLAPYVFTLLVFVLPNLFFTGAVFFTLASLTRSLLYTYLGVVVLFIGWIISVAMLGDVENIFVAGLIDPFGLTTLETATRYWTAFERNTALPDLFEGTLLLNRLLWTGVGALVFAAGYIAFDPARTGGVSRRRRRKLLEGRQETAAVTPRATALPAVRQSHTTWTQVRQFLQQARIEALGVLKSAPFIVLVAFGMINVFGAVYLGNRMFGTSVWPVTHLMLDAIEGSYLFILVIIVTFYAGELIGKERSIKLNEVYDALPVPTWVTLTSKLLAIALVIVACLAFGALTVIVYQLSQGYFALEPALYLKGLLIAATPFLLIAVLAVFLQVVTNNKFFGYLLMILFLISGQVLDSLDFDHNLYRFAGSSTIQYSDMNGYGHFLVPFFWFTLYWTCVALVLYGLSLLLRVRGSESSWKARLQQAGMRFRGPVRVLLTAGVLGAVATGSFIFYNTNVLNRYTPGDVQEERQALYEKRYRKYLDVPIPRIVAVRAEVDIYPEQRRMEARGHYLLRNKTSRPIDQLHVNLDPRVKVKQLRFADHEVASRDEEVGYTIYKLRRPLAPGAEMPLDFEVEVDNPGFVNGGSDTSLVYNGTFFNNRAYFPILGYDEGRQLIDRNDRRKHDLPPVLRMHKVDDLAARQNIYLGRDSDWIDFETVVSTTPGQIAIAPGYLQKEWTANGRRYFHYKMDAPILHFYSYLSADYTVKRDRWKDVDIEVYHHGPHTYNVDRMIEAVKKSLDYFTTNFGPYQHRQVRILEFPRYATFAQAFPNTIPFSESIGFIARLDDDPEAIDYPFYVTAHEVAHQWWAHQVIGGDVQGATLLSETMSQYSALMVMEKEYGRDKMRRFLKYELDRYLRDRGGEMVEEMPLMLVENQQYIHYRKGSVIMYALKDAIGEEALNRALARYVQAVKFQQPPFTNSVEFMTYIEEVTPPHLRPMVDDMFRHITLFDNRVTTASYRRRADGKYEVDLTVESKKMRADGEGQETPAPLGDWVDVGVFAEEKKGGKTEEKPLYLRKHRITQPTTRLQLVVDQVPARAGIDPYNKLVDRNSDDNRKRVDALAGTNASTAP